MSGAMAIRNPKRGKAHRKFGRWSTTCCRADSMSGERLFATLTEALPVERTAPEDRCQRCWPTPIPDQHDHQED